MGGSSIVPCQGRFGKPDIPCSNAMAATDWSKIISFTRVFRSDVKTLQGILGLPFLRPFSPPSPRANTVKTSGIICSLRVRDRNQAVGHEGWFGNPSKYTSRDLLKAN